MDKDKRIKQEKLKLIKIFKDMSKDKKDTLGALIDNASFMAVTLQDLQELINKNGTISEYQNGANQWGTKKSPEVEVYNSMIKNYSTIIKQLTDLLPKEVQKVESDGFDEFMIDK